MANDLIAKWIEEAACENNAMCSAEMDAKRRGTWFFQMSVRGFLSGETGGSRTTETVVGEFEVLEFASTFKELALQMEDENDGEDHQNQWRAAGIYTRLDMIRNGESLAFTKMRDAFSAKLVELRQQRKPFTVKFGLRKFSPKGGVNYQFNLELQSVFILDMQSMGGGEKILITFSNPKYSSVTPPANGDSEVDELRRKMNMPGR